MILVIFNFSEPTLVRRYNRSARNCFIEQLLAVVGLYQMEYAGNYRV